MTFRCGPWQKGRQQPQMADWFGIVPGGRDRREGQGQAGRSGPPFVHELPSSRCGRENIFYLCDIIFHLGVLMRVWFFRALRLFLVLGALYYIGYLFLTFDNLARNNVDVQGLLKWMNGNEKLSGWAQFYGAIIAIGLAIAVPAWQRHSQNLDRWRDGEDTNASLSQNSFFLLGEILSYVRGCGSSDTMPRSLVRDTDRSDDLLRRIHALELKEISPNRIIRLFHARGHVHNTNSAMTRPTFQNDPLSAGELQLFTDRRTHLEKLVEEAKRENDKAISARAHAHLWLLPRISWSITQFIVG